MKDFAKSIHVGNALFPASKYDDEIYKLEVEYQNVSRSGGNPSEILKKTAEIEKKIQHLKELRRKETGNSKVGNADVVKDGNVWVVLYAEGTKSKEFNSEAEAKKFAAQVGNRDVSPGHLKDVEEQIKNWEHALEKVEGLEKEKAKKILEDLKKERQQIRDNVGNASVEEQNEKLFHSLKKDVEEKEEVNDEKIEEVGNSKAGEKNVWKEGPYHIEQLTEDGNFGWYKMPKGSFVAYRNDVVYGNFKTLDEAKRKLQDEINKDKEYNRKYTTNSKTGNSLYAELNKDGKRVVIEENGSWYVYDKSGNISEQGHESNADNALGKWKAKGYNKKIGNAGYPILKSKVEELSKEGKSYEEVVKELLKFGFTREDIAQYEGYIREHIGNKKVGNSAYDDGAKKGKEDKRKGKLITAAGFEYHAPGYSYLSSKEKEEYKKGYYSTNDLKKEDIYKWGNSASDDKFAYVMREFDEGKLKTPDGKVVTDPEQAKAIAYSESKKAENGLARARNAMACNKKVGNWNSERTIDPVGKYPAFLKNLKNAIDLGVAAVNYDSVDEATLKAWVEQAKKEGYGAHIGGVQGHKVTLK